MVVIEQVSGVFTKVAEYLIQSLDPPQHQPVIKLATIPHKVRPTLSKTIPLERPNIKEEDDGPSPTDFQHNVHMHPSGPHGILPDVPEPPPRVRPEQPQRVDTEGPSSNVILICKKNSVTNFSLGAKFLQVR